MKKTIEIIHRPLGDRHPYEHTADERNPRVPFADQRVEIGFLTRPINAVKRASITFWINDEKNEQETKDAVCIGSQSDDVVYTEDGHLSEAAARAGLILGVDNWQGNIPEFPPGTKVSYQVTVETVSDSTQSQIYKYTVRKKITLQRVTNIYQGKDTLILELENPEEKVKGYIFFQATGDSHLKIVAGHGSYMGMKNLKQIIPNTAENSLPNISLESASIQINLNPLHIKLIYEDESVFKGLFAPQLIVGDNEKIESVILSFDSPQDEGFYGFGERFNALNQRGEKLDVRVYEQYKNHGLRTYMPMPLFVSSCGYGLLLNSLRLSVFDLAQENPERWTLEAEFGDEDRITLDVLPGKPAKLFEIVGRLNALTGRPILPPDWAFGLWMSSNEWNTQARVEEIVKQSQENGIPASVIVLEAWSDENTFYIWNDARYTPKPGAERLSYADFEFPPDGMWPDPKGMIEKLHQQGIRVLLWQIPILKKNEEDHAQLSNDKAHMLEKGYCVNTEENVPYTVRPFWFREGLLMDFTNRQGVDWWMNKREYLLDELGIDGFKTDGGEHIWGRDLLFSDGRRGDEVWNEYPNLYAGAYFEFAKKYKPDGITFSRAGYTGAQAFPCHWAGDENSTWEAFQRSIFAGLNAGISGVAFWGWDFAGFSGEIPTAELYLRATAMATFSPIMQYHSEFNHHQQPSNDRTPWSIAERTESADVLPVFRFFTHLRMNLMPYILHTARSASNTGIPMMRALCLAYPEDEGVDSYPYQYMFGESLLVAPITEPDIAQVEVYLPEGDWYSFWDGKFFKGGMAYKLSTTLEQIPVFVRANSLVPLNLNEEFQLGESVGDQEVPREKNCFKFYPGKKGSYTWFDETRQEDIDFTWEQTAVDEFVLHVPILSSSSYIILPDGFSFVEKSSQNRLGQKELGLPENSQQEVEVFAYREKEIE